MKCKEVLWHRTTDGYKIKIEAARKVYRKNNGISRHMPGIFK